MTDFGNVVIETKAKGGMYVCAPWPADILVAPHLLEEADGERIRVDGDILTFAMDNGGATYRRVGLSPGYGDAVHYTLEAGTFDVDGLPAKPGALL